MLNRHSTSTGDAADLPLAGITVLDFSQFLAGPSASLRPVSYTHQTLPTSDLV